MSDYRKYSNVVKIEKGYFEYRLFLSLDCGHEVYRYSKSVPEKVLCEHCNRSAWFPRRRTKRALDTLRCEEEGCKEPAVMFYCETHAP